MTPHLYDTAKSILLSNLDYSYLEIGSWDGSGIADLAVNFPNQFFFSIDPFIEDGDVRSGYTKGEKMLSVKDKFLKNTKDIKNIINFEISSKDFLRRPEASPPILFNSPPASFWKDFRASSIFPVL